MMRFARDEGMLHDTRLWLVAYIMKLRKYRKSNFSFITKIYL